MIIVGIVFVVIGVLNASKPDLSFRMNRWQYKNKNALEPSAAALTVTRIGGVVIAVAGVVLIVLGARK